jgi:hypothetical protein
MFLPREQDVYPAREIVDRRDRSGSEPILMNINSRLCKGSVGGFGECVGFIVVDESLSAETICGSPSAGFRLNAEACTVPELSLRRW